MKPVEMDLKDGTTEYWSIDELTRWMCLMEAFDFIHQKAEQLGVRMENMLNAKAIEEYIHGTSKFDGRFHSMRHDVGVEVGMGIL